MPQIISVSSTYRKAQLQDGNSVKRLRVGAEATLCITANTPRKSSPFFVLRARPCLSPFCRLQHLWMPFPVAALHPVEHCPANGLRLVPRFRTSMRDPLLVPSGVPTPVLSQILGPTQRLLFLDNARRIPTTLLYANVVITIISKPSHHYHPFPVLRPSIPTASGCTHPLEHTTELRPNGTPHDISPINFLLLPPQPTVVSPRVHSSLS